MMTRMMKVMVTMMMIMSKMMMMHACMPYEFFRGPIITGLLVCHLCEDATFVYDADSLPANRKSTLARTSSARECSS